MGGDERLPREARILMDQRWVGPFGIGRFASEVMARLGGTHHRVADWIPMMHPAEPVLLAAQVAAVRPTVFFSPAFSVPLTSGHRPVVATIHDLIHLRVPEERSASKALYYERLLKPVLRRQPIVLTVSEFSRAELVDWLEIEPERVAVVGDGTSMRRERAADRERVYPFPYLLYVGNNKPHKNLDRLLDAYRRSGLHERVRLVLVGGGLSSRGTSGVEVTGRVDEERLEVLYRDAEAVILPSTYEGFGLPVIEAFALGTKVVAGDIPALREVAGDLAVYVDPLSSDSIAEGIEAVLHGDGGGTVDERMARAALFTWDGVAERVESQLARAICR